MNTGEFRRANPKRAEESCLETIWIEMCHHRNWYYNMNHGRFCKRLFCCVFVIHTAIEPKHSFCSRTSFHSRCVSYENCKRLHRNYTLKHENRFAILTSVCNFHISLQFSYQFAILTFQRIVPMWMFAIFIWVCNFHMSLQFSYQFGILMSQLQHLLTWFCMDSVTMTLNSWTPPRLSVEDKDKLELSKIDYYLLVKFS